MSIKIDYTIEILYHFTCSQCHHWWSYAMMPTNNKMSLNKLFIGNHRLPFQ